MIYIYDNAITDDLLKSFDNKDENGEPFVKVIDPESAISLAAQLQSDNIKFPLVAIHRDPNTDIDTTLKNFTLTHQGRLASFDSETNTYWYELSMPIDLKYALTVITTRVADMDEIVKELLFKYSNMYFLTINLPYECDRKVRFGIAIDPNGTIDRSSSTHEYNTAGTLHQTIIPLVCQGCVLVSYRPVKRQVLQDEVLVEPSVKVESACIQSGVLRTKNLV